MNVAPSTVINTTPTKKDESQRWFIWRSFRKHRVGMIGLVMLTLMLLGVIFAPIIFSDQYRGVNHNADVWLAPMGTVDNLNGHIYLLGTDKYGRDNLALLFQGGRLSLIVALVPTIISLIVGSVIGATAGYFGGWIDTLLMRVTDFMLALPLLPAYLLALRVIRPNAYVGPFRQPPLVDDSWSMMLSIIAVFAIFGWMGISRLVRGLALSLRSQSFIEAARAVGAGTPRIIFRHLLPNASIPMLIAGMFMIGDFVILEAILAYLGMGFRDPVIPLVVSWGNMLAYNQDQAWFTSNLNPFEQIQGYLVLLPSLFLFITILSVNFIATALRDVLDPRREA
jgi:peptide/nickel transport system permease protein